MDFNQLKEEFLNQVIDTYFKISLTLPDYLNEDFVIENDNELHVSYFNFDEDAKQFFSGELFNIIFANPAHNLTKFIFHKTLKFNDYMTYPFIKSELNKNTKKFLKALKDFEKENHFTFKNYFKYLCGFENYDNKEYIDAFLLINQLSKC